ncbi:unnamed protein product [Triticum turgidum subsp. durum]|uniref:Uncharacterized protein n=1 Tax=Triticum turgidum subsp. durum TaxID=4567 RepID=A0A9R0QZ83_TRITD|nr:unnamed protein product [Triticum turgidum subsp. durum]
MLEREDTDGAEEAKKAYMAAREESGDTTEVASEEKVSSALIDKLEKLKRLNYLGTILSDNDLPFPSFLGYGNILNTSQHLWK